MSSLPSLPDLWRRRRSSSAPASSVRPPALTRAGLALALSAGTLTAVTAGTGSAGAADAAVAEPPTLALFAPSTRVGGRTRGGADAWVDLPVLVTPRGGTFDLRVARTGYDAPITVTQMVHEADGSRTPRPLPDLQLTGWEGLDGFLRVQITNPRGKTSSRWLTFCPNSYDSQRISPDGADRSTFPEWCSSLPFTLGTTWGINDGWASGVLPPWTRLWLGAGAGRYEITVTIVRRYAEALGVAPADRTVELVARVREGRGGHGHHPVPAFRTAVEEPDDSPRPRVRTVAEPPTDRLPDLRSLPAFDIGAHREGRKDLLAFGANVWVAGTSLLDIEGFRRPGEPVMDAYQYFYDGDEVVGRAPVGTMEFDLRDGHHHWHLLQFARFDLLDADQKRAVASHKQSFCIVPTDAVDISTDDAELRPWVTGLHSACGSRSALWIRETLPIGWGDTYHQGRAGQAFNITNLPNGTYWIRVTANPTGELFELDQTNNSSLRKVILKGRPGHRRVCVPALFGIDGSGACR